MTWINVISYDAAEGKVKTLYDRVKGPDNNVDNIMMLHSLRPHSMEAHMTMYKYVLHHTGNSIPKWFLETLGVWVSRLNDCDYCVEHHFAGLERLLADEVKSKAIRQAIEARNIDAAPLDDAQKCALERDARQITRDPGGMQEDIIYRLRAAGYSDGDLEINQVTAYFNYANRTVLGLGCSTDKRYFGVVTKQIR